MPDPTSKSSPRTAAIAITIFGLIAGAASIFAVLKKDDQQDVTQTSSGDFSPAINAQGDVKIEINTEVKTGPRFITAHEGAGAAILTEPDFSHYLKEVDKVNRVINGTPVEILERRKVPVSEKIDRSIDWYRVRILEGDDQDLEGWTLQSWVKRVEG